MSDVLLSFTVPGTPRPRQRARKGQHGWYTPAATQRYQRDVALEALHMRGAGQPPLTGVAIELVAYMPDKRRRDLDGVLANVLDALVKARVLADDSHTHVPQQRITSEIDRDDPRLDVVIRRAR